MSSGVYTIEQAAQLVGAKPDTISRWFTGDSAIFEAERRGKDINLDFRDLVCAHVLNLFRTKFKFSLQSLRRYSDAAARELGDSRPFSLRRFTTDGRTILLRVGEDADNPKGKKHQIRDLANGQLVIRKVFEPLLQDIEYDKGAALRWWPLGIKGGVVIDPERHFGEPILAKSGIPTRVLFGPVSAGAKQIEVAEWFEIGPTEISKAVKYERTMRRKAA